MITPCPKCGEDGWCLLEPDQPENNRSAGFHKQRFPDLDTSNFLRIGEYPCDFEGCELKGKMSCGPYDDVRMKHWCFPHKQYGEDLMREQVREKTDD